MLEDNPRRDQSAINGACDRRRGNADQQRVKDRSPNIGVEDGNRQHGCGMRRHQAVVYGKAGKHGQSDQDQGGARAAGNGKHNRYQQNEADLKEDGQAHDQRCAHHRPGHAPLAEKVNQGLRDAIGGSGFRHHFAQHGAQANHDRDMPQRIAGSRFEGANDVSSRIPVAAANASETISRERKALSLTTAISRISATTDAGGGEQQVEAVAVEHRRKGSRIGSVHVTSEGRGRKRPPRCPWRPHPDRTVRH